MTPIWTFIYGLVLLVIFGWYLATDVDRRKRILGSVLTVLLVAFCIQAVNPPFDVKDATGKIIDFGKIHLGLDLQGGTSFLIRLSPPADEKGAPRKITQDMVEQAVEAIRKRVDKFGVSEPIITPQGTDRILVQIPGLDDAKIAEARAQLQQVAKLEFKLVYPESASVIDKIEKGEAVIPPGYTLETMSDTREGMPVTTKLLVKKNADLLGSHVTHAFAFYDQQGWGVSLQFDSQGADQFAKLTKQVAQEHTAMAIVLDGKVISAPGVNEAENPEGILGGRAQITGGGMDEKYVRSLASALENPLQTPVAIEETRSASATLGQDSIKSGIYAGIGGLLLVLVFVVIYYRFAGLVAVFGLVVNIVLLFGAMAMFNFVLTLPGIAGIILTIGLAVDANVLIYERLREEMAAGKSLVAAINAAYEKAFTVIFDANATTLITAAILFWRASGPVKGFAVTLTVGIIASVFTAMVVTRTVFSWALQAGFLKKITMLHLISGKNHDFLGKRFLWITISLTAIVISVAGFAIRGDKNFGIDFKGGDLLLVEATQKPETVADVKKILEPLDLGEVPVVQIEHDAATNKDYISIRSPYGTSDKIKDQLQKAAPDAGFKVRQEDKVGKLVGGELERNSLIAFGLGMLGILVYVTLRFEFSFAIGALVALLHDVIITVGVFALCGRELSLVMVGAILTIAGYSINDTIVVYDRIREGLHSGRKGTIQTIMNASINETLSRTLLTSGCTLFSVAALFFFGGPVLHDFAFAILIGVVVGTYSSIFIASPIVLWWSGRRGEDLKSEVKKTPSTPVSAS